MAVQENNYEFGLSCPIPINEYPNILLAHGGGGKLTHQLIEKLFLPAFKNEQLNSRHDGAVLEIGDMKLAFTTDSYVVKPLFFPGGDIGTLAVNGTVNDLAMCGARPLFLSIGLIIEEGFSIDALWRVVNSLKDSAAKANVKIVTGDTKVVDHGKGDGIFINSSGVGLIEHDLNISPLSIKPGDKIILNGDIGRHGIAIMASREGLTFESTIESDCAPLNGVVQKLLDAGIEPHCLRDLTRGGLATSLIEIAETSGLTINIEETEIPILEQVSGACEILGLDPLYVANEGRFVAIVPYSQAEKALKIIQAESPNRECRIIGEVRYPDKANGGFRGMVTLTTKIGSSRLIDMLSGEQLPRIC
ncbi:MAG: hydrogenase expression/formation protein HypE [candidate division Zixibacteria bacterium]|nr:hydrogenase expression/formation protein HypE [candidate division Zixibacteria bacterium]